METSILIAKLMGPVIMVMAIALLRDADGMRKMGREFINNRPLVFVAGVFTLLGGLAVVIHHNIWVANWPVLITIVGWAMVFGGIVRVALPELVKCWGEKMIGPKQGIMIVGLVWLLLGLCLSFAGFS